MANHVDAESELITRAQRALSTCNWEIGECASTWTQKYAKGRTDADFGALIGLSGDQVYQRRRVWESFADVCASYTNLKWSHFYVALNWDDSAECLQWANDMDATVAEMRAWRRAQHGEDLSEPGVEEPPFNVAPDYLSAETGMVRDPGDFDGRPRTASLSSGVAMLDAERAETVPSAARDSSQSDYAPFGKGARGSAPSDDDLTSERPSVEQIVKKTCVAVERAVSALTPEILDEFTELPIALQQRLLTAVENLQARTAGLC